MNSKRLILKYQGCSYTGEPSKDKHLCFQSTKKKQLLYWSVSLMIPTYIHLSLPIPFAFTVCITPWEPFVTTCTVQLSSTLYHSLIALSVCLVNCKVRTDKDTVLYPLHPLSQSTTQTSNPANTGLLPSFLRFLNEKPLKRSCTGSTTQSNNIIRYLGNRTKCLYWGF